MRIFISKDIFLDIFLNKVNCSYNSLLTVNKITETMEGYISALTVKEIICMMKNETKEDKEKVASYLLDEFSVVELNQEILQEALEMDYVDMTLAINFLSAKTVNCETIVTRNKEEFKKSALNVFTPEEFLAFYKI